MNFHTLRPRLPAITPLESQRFGFFDVLKFRLHKPVGTHQNSAPVHMLPFVLFASVGVIKIGRKGWQ